MLYYVATSEKRLCQALSTQGVRYSNRTKSSLSLSVADYNQLRCRSLYVHPLFYTSLSPPSTKTLPKWGHFLKLSQPLTTTAYDFIL
ncbi:hypothetical protein CEXT_154441 [Caerostris extrusa]|uniref:Uncharacterized protein n=1 Tax=Caerostris extrusa TaxID=172846 RepID=A0AAV4Y7V4_CAEEX|nr:hypothetical protein CEXT_154441 [Caerostris extrusa]